MKPLLLFSAILLILTSCNHYKWASKHPEKICQFCTVKDSVIKEVRDTVIVAESPWDFLEFDGVSELEDSIPVDLHTNSGAPAVIIKYKDKIIVKFKPLPVAVVVPKYFEREVRTVEIEKPVRSFYWWEWLIVIALGLFTSWLCFRKIKA